jgi:hypothetical protein
VSWLVPVLGLTIGAVLIFPRLAFVTLANNLMVLSIRSMLTEFFCTRNWKFLVVELTNSLDEHRYLLLLGLLIRVVHPRARQVSEIEIVNSVFNRSPQI